MNPNFKAQNIRNLLPALSISKFSYWQELVVQKIKRSQLSVRFLALPKTFRVIMLVFFLGLSSSEILWGQNIEKDSLYSVIQNSSSPTSQVKAFKTLISLISKKQADSIYSILKEKVTDREFLLDRYNLNLIYAKKTMDDDPVKAIKLVEESIKIAESLDSVKMVINAKSDLGIIYQMVTHDEAKSLLQLQESYDLFKKRNLKDDMVEADIIFSFGVYYGEAEKNYQKANEYLLKAIPLFKRVKNDYYVALCYFNIGECAFEEKRYFEAMHYYDSALIIQKRLNKFYHQAFTHGAKGKTHLANKKYIQAMAEFDTAYNISIQPNVGRANDVWLRWKGNVYYEMGDFYNAKLYYEKALPLIRKTNFEVLVSNLSKLARTYDTLHLYRQASEIKSKLIIAKDSTSSHNDKQIQRELQVKFQVKEFETELSQLQLETKSKQLIITLLSLLVLAVIIITVFIIFKQRQIARIKTAEIELQRKNAEAQLEIKTLSENKLKIELDLKNQELTSQALNIVQKTELLDQIQAEISMIKASASGESVRQLNILASKFNASNRIDKDWENFKIYFEQVHKGFFDNLCVTYPDLSPKEIRLCALLKLNMDTKQIATILEISPDSAKMARHRIRKKLGLSGEENLVNFFNRFNIVNDQ